MGHDLHNTVGHRAPGQAYRGTPWSGDRILGSLHMNEWIHVNVWGLRAVELHANSSIQGSCWDSEEYPYLVSSGKDHSSHGPHSQGEPVGGSTEVLQTVGC